jgi:hypothetical protein
LRSMLRPFFLSVVAIYHFELAKYPPRTTFHTASEGKFSEARIDGILENYPIWGMRLVPNHCYRALVG